MMRRGFGAVASGGPGRPVGATGLAVPTVVVMGVTGVAPLRRHDRLRAEPQERGSGLEDLASTTGVYMLPTSACVCAIPPVPLPPMAAQPSLAVTTQERPQALS